VDVLVGIEGSSESGVALRTVVELLGTRIGRLTLAGVVSFDNTSQQAVENAERAVRLLEESAASTHPLKPGTLLLFGEPAGALTSHASEDGYELLVIGRRGRGASKTLLGSTASRAPVGTGIPVLIV
jgi:nucleotide-binding universal stress UspA family protein